MWQSILCFFSFHPPDKVITQYNQEEAREEYEGGLSAKYWQHCNECGRNF